MSQIGKYFALGASGLDTLTGNSGGVVNPIAGNINILGSGQVTVAGNDPVAGTMTISLTGLIAEQFTTDAGIAIPAAGNLNVLGGTNINSAGAGDTVTINLDNDVVLDGGSLEVINGLLASENNEDNTTGANLTVYKSRLGGAITSGDILGGVVFGGDGGAGLVTGTIGAIIRATSAGTISATQVPAKLEFFTHPDSVTTATLRMSIDTTGEVTIAASDSGASLTVTGTAVVDNLQLDTNTLSSTNTNGNIVLAPDGSGTVNIDYATQNSVAIYGASGALDEVGPLTDGQLVIGSTGSAPVAATLTAGAGIAIVEGAGSITISADNAGFNWSVVASDQIGADNQGFFTNDTGNINIALPATSSVGDTFQVCQMNAVGTWTITQAAGQTVRVGNDTTTTGAGGSLVSTDVGDWITLVCSVANTDWIAKVEQGNITIV